MNCIGQRQRSKQWFTIIMACRKIMDFFQSPSIRSPKREAAFLAKQLDVKMQSKCDPDSCSGSDAAAPSPSTWIRPLCPTRWTVRTGAIKAALDKCAAARSTRRCQPNSSWPEWYYSRRSQNTDGTVFNILQSQAVPSSLCPCRNHLQSAAKGRYNFTRRKACFQHCSDLLPRPAEARCIWWHVL